MNEPMGRSEFLNLAGVCEGALIALAFGLGWLLNVDPVQQLYPDWRSVAIGCLCALPLLAGFALLYRAKLKPFERIRTMLLETLVPPLAECRWYDLVLLALMAGLCEELLFRGTLQLWFGQWGLGHAVAGTAILFGLVHCVTPTYAIVAAVIGAYLSGTMYLVPRPNLLIPVTTHAVYDLFGFLIVIADYRRRSAEAEDSTNAADSVSDGD